MSDQKCHEFVKYFFTPMSAGDMSLSAAAASMRSNCGTADLTNIHDNAKSIPAIPKISMPVSTPMGPLTTNGCVHRHL